MTAPADFETRRARHGQVRAVFLAAQDQPADQRAAWLVAQDLPPAVQAEVASLLEHIVDDDLVVPPTTPPAHDPLGAIGTVLDDRYRIDTHVAEGGFGHVYRATHLRWQRPVAVKFFKPFLTADDQEALKQAFVKEGVLLTELSRKTTAIVQSYDLGTWQSPRGPILFTALEWLDGRTLQAAMAEDPPPWGFERVDAVLGPVAQALAVAHASGVAHRDVKPGNIFLVTEAGLPAVKLLDFGIAKVAAERASGFQSTAGKVAAFTVGYAAPEQIDRQFGSTGPWTDVHALALVAVHLLVGRLPYGNLDMADALARACDPHRPTPRRLGLAVPPAVEAVFARALALDPQARYPDAGTFWRDLVAAYNAPRRIPRWWWIAAVAAAAIGGLGALAARW